MPDLQALADQYRADGVELVTVVTSGATDRIRMTARRVGLAAPVLFPGGDVLKRWKVSAVPWTVVFDRNGKAVAAYRGGQSAGTFEQAIKKRL